jgi:hypothetical protein
VAKVTALDDLYGIESFFKGCFVENRTTSGKL